MQGWVKQLTQAFSWAETVQGHENLQSAEGSVASANIFNSHLARLWLALQSFGRIAGMDRGQPFCPFEQKQ